MLPCCTFQSTVWRVRGLPGETAASGAETGSKTGLECALDHSMAALRVSDHCGSNKSASSNTAPVRRSHSVSLQSRS